MVQWRIRVVVPDTGDGRHALRSALAKVPVAGLRPDPAETAELTGDLIVELAEDGALEDLLRTLHEISPQVFISRVPAPQPETPETGAIRVRKLTPGAR